jgi:dethiobiotin synthetase
VQPRTIFITGTDTGVGKTVLTGLLFSQLRQRGRPVIALKPFCSGGRADAQILHGLQNGDLTLDQVNPFYFQEAVAPLVAARLHRRRISLAQTLSHIRQLHAFLRKAEHAGSAVPASNPLIQQSTNPVLLIEGAGGLLAPLGESFSAADLIKMAACEVLVASANRLGTINHTLLTAQKLQSLGVKKVKAVMLQIERPSKTPRASRTRPDASSRSNYQILSELLTPVPVFSLPYLPELTVAHDTAATCAALQKAARRLEPLLAKILAPS